MHYRKTNKKESRKKTKIPDLMLITLKTFVAPILPDPSFLISFFKKILVNKKPKGIEPNR